MSFGEEDTSVDKFLGGALHICQPVNGYRAATDPVFLAAAVSAKQGDQVLELGCGVGVASLCLKSRHPDVDITGLELQENYAELARFNAMGNNIPFDVIEGDLKQMPAVLRSKNFDHVIANPPFFEKGTVTKPQNEGKATSHLFENVMSVWVDAGLRRLRPKGIITIIQLAEQLPDILIGLSGRAGDIQVLPLVSRPGRAAKRVIVRARKSVRTPMKLLSPFHVHGSGEHLQSVSDYTPDAVAILRDGAALAWGKDPPD